MQLVDEHGITGTAMAPTMLNMVLQHPQIDEYSPRLAAQHRLRRGGDAGRGAAVGDRALRTDRLLGLRHDRARRQRADVPEVGARAGRQGRRVPPRLVRHADVPGRRQGRRRAVRRVPAGRRRRDRDPRRAGPEGLLPQRGGHGQGVPRRLVPHRRHGPARRGGVLLHRRPDEGHDHHRRRERLQPRGRGGALHPPGGVRGRRRRTARPEVGRERDRRRSSCARGRRPPRPRSSPPPATAWPGSRSPSG